MELKEVKRNMKAMEMMITFFRMRNFSSFSSLVNSFLEMVIARSALATSVERRIVGLLDAELLNYRTYKIEISCWQVLNIYCVVIRNYILMPVAWIWCCLSANIADPLHDLNSFS